MSLEPAELSARLDALKRTHRRLERRIDASGVGLRHRLVPVPAASGSVLWDEWPRKVPARRSRGAMTAAVLVLAAAIVGAAAQRVSTVLARQAEPALQLQAATVETPPAATAEPAPQPQPVSIRIRAERPARARVTVDGAALEWRLMGEGDEFYARPRREILIEASDGAALLVMVEGRRVTIGSAGAPVAVRLTSEGAWRPAEVS